MSTYGRGMGNRRTVKDAEQSDSWRDASGDTPGPVNRVRLVLGLTFVVLIAGVFLLPFCTQYVDTGSLTLRWRQVFQVGSTTGTIARLQALSPLVFPFVGAFSCFLRVRHTDRDTPIVSLCVILFSGASISYAVIWAFRVGSSYSLGFGGYLMAVLLIPLTYLALKDLISSAK